MQKKDKILIMVFVVALTLSAVLTYHRTFVQKDYEIIISPDEVLYQD